MPRLSTLAVSTFRPALKVLSTTFPESTCFSLVRTKAGPLPGLTCWNSTTVQSWPPSSLSTRPFLRSFVVATVAESPESAASGPRKTRARHRAYDERVVDPDAAAAREVDSWFDGDRHASVQLTHGRR